MAERHYQSKLIKDIKKLIPGCVVIKNDPNYIQGIPDLIILYRDRWAALEVKVEEGAPSQPNQDYYIQQFGEMSYASYIYPEIEGRVLSELQHAFGIKGQTRVS